MELISELSECCLLPFLSQPGRTPATSRHSIVHTVHATCRMNPGRALEKGGDGDGDADACTQKMLILASQQPLKEGDLGG